MLGYAVLFIDGSVDFRYVVVVRFFFRNRSVAVRGHGKTGLALLAFAKRKSGGRDYGSDQY